MPLVREVEIEPTYSRPYKVVIGDSSIRELPRLVENVVSDIDKVVVFVQESVRDLAPTHELIELLRERYETHVEVVVAGEGAKDMSHVLNAIKFLHEIGATKSTLIIGVGGGALGDFVGFVSSIYMRGLPLVLIPTTLLSMVDSAIGGKNAINMFEIKNVVGTIYQPRLVVEDLRYIYTLPEREFCSGLAEVIKYGVTIDPEILKLLHARADKVLTREVDTLVELIERSVKCKGWIVHLDEREERDIRQVLNYGHTVGHAIEACAEGKLTHGECVMIGMVVESDLGNRMGYTDPDVHETLIKLAEVYRLPYRIPSYVSKEKMLLKIEYDKKRHGNIIKLPVVKRPGEFEIVKLELIRLLNYLNNLLEEYYER